MSKHCSLFIAAGTESMRPVSPKKQHRKQMLDQHR